MIAHKNGGRPTKRPPEEELRNLYLDHTASELAERYNTKISTVRAWIRYYRMMEKESVKNEK